MKYIPEFCSLTGVFCWMSLEDMKTGSVYRFQGYLGLLLGCVIYSHERNFWMDLQLLGFLAEICWLVKKGWLGKGDSYVYGAMAMSLSGLAEPQDYLLVLFFHQLIANLFFGIFQKGQKKLPVFRQGAPFAFIPSLFYSWVSVLLLSSGCGR